MSSSPTIVPTFDCFSDKQKKIIEKLEIPERLTFYGADQFDDKYVCTKGNWKFRASGQDYKLDFTRFYCPYQEKLCKYLVAKHSVGHMAASLSKCFEADKGFIFLA
ncbi:hypothetical protein [Photobacterium leiognathi]|uniref:hypothetical protein n=1 Tax=Photobacterium leiognathi TaxID=553611 RepID=UPI002738308C|nr:hypothetical protein [Photobacterium leiognathi]